jgi:uncharacterized membrane protein
VSWAVLALVLLWIGQQLGSRTLRYVSLGLYALTLYRCGVIDLPQSFGRGVTQGVLWADYWPQLLERVVQYGVLVLSLGAAYKLLERETGDQNRPVGDENDLPDVVPAPTAAHVLLGATAFTLFLYLHLELNRTVGFAYAPLKLPILTLLWLALCGMLLRLAVVRGEKALWVLAVGVSAIVLLKLVGIDLPSWSLSGQMVYRGPYSPHDALLRLLDFGAVTIFFAVAWACAVGRSQQRETATYFAIAGMAVLFLYLTLELNTLLEAFLPGLRAGGISILWAVFALGWLLRGIWRNEKPLRYAGLALFAVVIGKVFFNDLKTLDQFYRIVAFIILGVVVLAGSFLYLKYRDTFAVNPPENHP